MIFFSSNYLKKSNCELCILHVLAILGDNKTSCLFWAKGQGGGGWGGGVIQIEKISYQSPWSPCLMMTSSLLKVTCPQFRMISFKYSEMMKTFSIKYGRSHKINSYEIKRAELHILEKRKKKPSIGLFYFASHISVIHGKVFQSILSITLY